MSKNDIMQRSIKIMTKTIVVDFFHSLFPNLCVACDLVPKAKGSAFCLECVKELPYTDHFNLSHNNVKEHFIGRIPVHHVAALFYFKSEGIVQNMLHKLKYKKNQDVGVVLGELLGKKLLESTHFSKIDIIIPVPIHLKKQLKRGYNQSEIIGRSLSKYTHIPMISDAVMKIIHNDSQTGKSRVERTENVQSVYKLNPQRDIKGLHLLVLDDVITTGATVEACCLELLKGHPASINIVSVAAGE